MNESSMQTVSEMVNVEIGFRKCAKEFTCAFRLYAL